MPLHVSSTNAHRQEVKIVLYSLWYHHTYRWPSRAQVERGLVGMCKNLFYSAFISSLYMFRAPCAHRQEVKIVLYDLWYH